MSSTQVREAEVICRSQDGREVARIRLFAGNDDSPIWQLNPHEARRLSETEVQLRENGRYEYELTQCPAEWRVRCSLARCSIRARARHKDFGLIETGAHCGSLRIDVVTADGTLTGTSYVEVRSVKLDYREQYRAMLNDLGARMMALLLDARSSSQMRLAPAWRDEPHALQQQIEFLREALESSAFRNAVHRIVTFPHRRLRSEHALQPIQKSFKHDRHLIHQLTSGNPRIALPNQHSLAARMRERDIARPSLPAMVTTSRKTDDLDTVENQFVKFALASFRDFASRAAQALRQYGSSWEIVVERAQRIECELNQLLSHGFFAGISPLRVAPPFGSPVLQRKAGYREVFQTWLRFEANARVTWEASDDIFHAGKHDIARLYEYWLFFQLLDWFCDRFNGAKLDTRQLIESDDGGRVKLKLKHGIVAGPFEGIFANNQRRLRAQLHYNRAFPTSSNRSKMGSWTRPMRPDYTLTFWPADYGLQEAEAQELAVHLHFDAKYRVEDLRELLGDENDNTPADAEPEGEHGNYKRADLLKMHAYRDAIRRSEGAYVLYPGVGEIRFLADASSEAEEIQETGFLRSVMFDFHEILPSVGAFAVVPDSNGQAKGMRPLVEFLDAVLEHLCNRATQREQRTYHVFDVARVAEAQPPAIPYVLHEKDEEGYRAPPPFEQLIIVAWNERAKIEWMLKRQQIALRLGDKHSVLLMVKELSAASHILLGAHGDATHSGLFRIKHQAGIVMTRDDLVAQGYPRAEGEDDDIFAVFNVEPDPSYADWKWDNKKVMGAVEAYERRKSARKNVGRIPSSLRLLSLGDLISAAVFE